MARFPRGHRCQPHSPVLGALTRPIRHACPITSRGPQTASQIGRLYATWWALAGFEDFNFNKSVAVTRKINDLDFEWTVYFESVQDRFVDNGTRSIKNCGTLSNHMETIQSF